MNYTMVAVVALVPEGNICRENQNSHYYQYHQELSVSSAAQQSQQLSQSSPPLIHYASREFVVNVSEVGDIQRFQKTTE